MKKGKKRSLDGSARGGGDSTGDNPRPSEDDEKKISARPQYGVMNVYGEHKRAVSSVQLAPAALTKDRASAIVAASASADGSVKLWDIAMSSASSQSGNAEGDAPPADSIPAAHDPTAGSRRDKKRTSLKEAAQCLGHNRGINCVAWHPTQPLLATASDDKTVRLWDAVTSDCLVEGKGHDNFVMAVDVHHQYMCSGSFDETVKLWDIRSGDCLLTLPAHSDPVTAVSFNRDGTCIASSSHDGLIRLWDVATGECLKTLYDAAARHPPVGSVKYSPNSKYVLAGTLDHCLRLWPVSLSGSNQCAKLYTCLTNPTTVDAAAAKPPPEQKQPSSAESPVAENNSTLPKYHVNSKYSIVSDFMYDGRTIVTGSETGQVVLYDLQTTKVAQVLTHHEDAVLAVSAHNTRPILCSGGMTNDRRVEFWVPQHLQTATGADVVAMEE